MCGAFPLTNTNLPTFLSYTCGINFRFFELGRLHARMFDLTLHIPVRYDMLLRRLASSPDNKV